MEQDIRLLQELYDQARMGGYTIQILLKDLPDNAFARELAGQLETYRKEEAAIRSRLKEAGCVPEDLTGFEKKRTEWMMKWELLRDRSISHMAEMLILGSDMGVIHSIRSLNQFEGADPGHIRLAEKMLRQEEKNVERWKAYL